MVHQQVTPACFAGLNFLKSGKVRDIYDLGDKLLLYSSDRISCFDVVLPTPIPRKGEILTKLSAFWFDFTKDIISNHFITDDVKKFPPELRAHEEQLKGRSMLVKKAKPVAFECVVRGYLSGSGWQEYQKSQTVCGVKLPPGLKESDKLPQAIFTPSTKESAGHDVNVSYEYVVKSIGKDMAQRLRDISLTIYQKASEYALSKGIIIADTKFEFGTIKDDNTLIFIDEALTPDSSRFWPKDQHQPGRPQASFDKQYVRDYLLTLDWDKTYPGPALPEKVVQQTIEKYLQAYQLLTGKTL